MEEFIYLAISEALTSEAAIAYFNAKGVKPIATVDLFNSQYLYEKDELAYPLPAVFVEFAPAVYTQRGRNTEEAREMLRIHVEQKTLASSASYSPNQDEALKVLRTFRCVHDILAFTTIEGVGKLHRAGRAIDTDHGNAPVHIWEYLLEYHDASTDRYADYSAEGTGKIDLTKQLVQRIVTEEYQV